MSMEQDLHAYHQSEPLGSNKKVEEYIAETTKHSIRMLQVIRDVAGALGLRGKTDEETLRNLERYAQGALGLK